MRVPRWKKGWAAVAAVAVALLMAPGSVAGGIDGDGPDGAGGPATSDDSVEQPLDDEADVDPFDGLDLSDPLAARLEVQRRLGESAEASEVLTELVQVAFAELVASEERSAAANEWLAAARADAEAARDESARASTDADAAARDAIDARDAARDALVDAYMSPPDKDTSRALVSVSDVNDAFFLHGLLSSRAASLAELVAAADEAEAEAAAASADAELSSVAAEAAAAEATAASDAAAAAAEETGERLADLQLFTELIEAEVASLEMVDAILERVVEERAAAAAAAAGPPVSASEVSAVAGTSIRVHRSVVGAVSAMLAAAAEDGVVLDGYGWRTVESQVALRHAHCGSSPEQVYLAPASSCSPPTARPGASMHERGLAVDFSNCGTRSTACYQWLAEHAHRFGFFNLPSEPWHWSVNGN